MPSFAETLREERENHRKTLEEMAEATGIRLGYLEALERDEIGALPGRAFGKLYIRAYAEVLGFDPRPLIEAYDREQNAKEREALPPIPAAAPAAAARPVEAALARWREEKAQEAAMGQTPEFHDDDEPPVEDAEPEPEPVTEPEPEPEPQAEPEFVWARERGPAIEPVIEAVEPAIEPVIEAVEPTIEPVIEVVEPTIEPVIEVEREALPPRSARERPRWLGPALVFAVLATGVIAGVWLFRSEDAPPGVAPAAPPQEAMAATEPPAAEMPSPVPPPEEPVEPPPAAAVPAPSGSDLSVPEFGVGRRIVQRRLEGETDRFSSGEMAYFFTRVVGGRAGERIRHVWLHEGRAQQSIRLRLGSSSWRTHSSKRVGARGSWTIEARDEDGNVLARASFVCE